MVVLGMARQLARAARVAAPTGLGEPARLDFHYGKVEGRPWETLMLGTILIIVLILLVIGALPTWGHSRSWGYFPSGGLGLILVIIVVLVLIGRI
jgi:hypothetical protein